MPEIRQGIAAVIAALALFVAAPADAQVSGGVDQAGQRLPVLISADQLDYDQSRAVVIAIGNVEISQGNRVLRADRVDYNQRTRVVVATGKVTLLEPSGEILFSDRIELTDDFRDGVIENLGLLFPDSTRVAATGGVRTGGERTDMAKVVMSPCRVCEEDPSRAPLWQIKARRVVHDQETRDITYRDARLEVFGLPVFYSPYFRHADPTVRRRSGFLAPIIGSDSQLGQTVRIPYFWAISPDKDLTITPFITTRERAALFLEYRQRFKRGAIIMDGSFTHVGRRDGSGRRIDGDVSRGHLFTQFRYDLDENWRMGLDGRWASDDTYLRRYNVTNHEVLTTTGWIEGFHNRNYTEVRFYHFQGLRLNDRYRRTPIVAPLMQHRAIGEPRGGLGRWQWGTEMVALSRFEGPDSRRLSFDAGWSLPLTHEMGWVLTASANVYGDFYSVSGVERLGRESFNGGVARVYPQAVLDVRYPFVRELGNVRHVIEPRAALILSPAGLNTSRIPNEDSRDFEFDDSNLFDGNRFPGRDRVDDGTRFVYGLRSAFYGNRGGYSEIFVGQSLRLTGGREFGAGTGLDRTMSDIVGRVSIYPRHYLGFNYRFRYNYRAATFPRNEISLHAGVPRFNVSLGYLEFAQTSAATEFTNRREVAFNVSSQINENWRVFGGARYDLTRSDGLLLWRFGAVFQNECCTVQTSVDRSFFQDRDIRPSTRVMVMIVLKHLGEIQGGL